MFGLFQEARMCVTAFFFPDILKNSNFFPLPLSPAPFQPHTFSAMAFFSRLITVKDMGLRLPW